MPLAQNRRTRPAGFRTHYCRGAHQHADSPRVFQPGGSKCPMRYRHYAFAGKLSIFYGEQLLTTGNPDALEAGPGIAR